MQFSGTLDELKLLVEGLGQPGHWVPKGAFEMFVIDDEETNIRINWWPGSGQLTLVGDPAQRGGLEERLRQLLGDTPAEPAG